MSELDFFEATEALSLSTLIAIGEASTAADADPTRTFRRVAALERAGPQDVAAFTRVDDPEALAVTRAGACFVAQEYLAQVPPQTLALVCRDPIAAIERVAARLYPSSLAPGPIARQTGVDADASVHEAARLEAGVVVDPGVVIGPGTEIGAGTTIGAGSVIGAGVRIGRGSAIDAHVSIRDALIGDRVVIHAGARIGLGGSSDDSMARSPHIGRVIIQDDVEIGANVVIERGARDDTTIGEGTRIAALVVVPAGTTTPRRILLDRSPFPRT